MTGIVFTPVFLAGRLHGQSFGRFFASAGGGGFRLLLKGAVFGIVATLVTTLGGTMLVGDIRPGLEPAQWAALVLPVVALVFIQATAGELMFRGYLLQQLEVRSRHWMIWAALPSFLFGLVCYALVKRSGSLWPAVGLHVTINLVFLLLVGAERIATGTQLWFLAIGDVVQTMKSDLIVTALMLGFVLSPLGRIFDENNVDPDRSTVGKPAL